MQTCQKFEFLLPSHKERISFSRMPVILHQEDEASWLEPSKATREAIEPFLHPYEDNGLEMYEVSSDVNVVKNNDNKLVYPIDSH